MASGDAAKAVALAAKIRDSADDPAEGANLAAEILSSGIPDWHFKLVLDEVRNAAFDAALRRAIEPGRTRVLDIGSGTGLLALMAARAGAAQVFSCEMNLVVAGAAKEIVAANGYTDRIQVLPKKSTELDADRDLGGKVDVIVTEIVSNDMLGEDALPTMEHAVAHLLKPGGRVIPVKGSVRVALAYDPKLSRKRMGIVDGFDLSAFNKLADSRYNFHVTDDRVRLLSEAADLFEFDFRSTTPSADVRAESVLTSTGGPVNCVAQWIHLEMDEVGIYENRPGQADYSCWAVWAYPLLTPLETCPGDKIIVHGSHDRFRVRVWA